MRTYANARHRKAPPSKAKHTASRQHRTSGFSSSTALTKSFSAARISGCASRYAAFSLPAPPSLPLPPLLPMPLPVAAPEAVAPSPPCEASAPLTRSMPLS